MARLSALLGLVLLAAPAAAEIARYTESPAGPGSIALGYPVPWPQDEAAPFDGFRSHDGLIRRLAGLSFASAEFGHRVLGSSLEERDIHAFIFGRQALGSTPALLQVGGVHAREWAAPEAVTHIAEQLVAGLAGDGLERYLADRFSIVLAPVMNPDGFLATQRDADRTRTGEDPFYSDSDPQYPRDGRQRRKNLRDSDGLIDTAGDALRGVDLNRNIGAFWNTSSGSSSDRRSLVYHGAERESEPETQALLQAVHLIGERNLRLFIDTHSFGRLHFYNDTGQARLHTLTRQLARAMGRVPAVDYAAVREPAQSGIGANDEYFAYAVQVPAFTLELEPGLERQAAEYGGDPDVSHSGFILPEAEIARVREEAWQMALYAYYHQAGPPILRQVTVREAGSGSTIYAAAWQDNAAGRALNVTRDGPLDSTGAYRLELVFDKPMRWADAQGDAAQYPGQNITLAPAIELLGSSGQSQELGSDGRWQSSRYRHDRYVLDFSPNARLGSAGRLSVSVRDLSAHALDADPATVASWAQGHWTGYEDTQGRSGDAGGTDQQFCLPLSPGARCDGPAQPPPPTSEESGGGGGSGSPALWLLLALAASRRRTPA